MSASQATRPGPSRAARTAAVLSPGVAVVVALVTTGLVGGLSPLGIPGLPDPGEVTRVGLPVVQSVRDLAALVTVGVLVVAAWCVGPDPSTGDRVPGEARGRLVTLAQLTATVWALSSALLAVLVFSDASGSRVGAAGFWEQAVFFTRSYELGQYLLWGCGIAALLAVGCALTVRTATIGALAVLALAALWPIALTGHAAGTLDHDQTVSLQMFHLVGVSVWAGGLIAIVVVGRSLGPGLATACRRFSTLAGAALVLVTVSGILGALLRLDGPRSWWSGYGALLGLKLAAVVTLGVSGWWHRHKLLNQLDVGRGRAFWRLVAGEVVVLAGAAGLGVALSRTPPPTGGAEQRPLTAAESMLGAGLPGPLDLTGWFTTWRVDALFLPVAAAAVLAYVGAVIRLRKRGHPWPVLRTLSWIAGWLLFVWVTNGAPGVYGRVLFSMHMVQHMTLAMAVPVFLVLATPVTLALRALPRRSDDSRGAREWLLQVVYSLPVQVLSHPVVATGLFVVSTVVFYYSPAFETSLESHTAHVVMTLHFMLTGYLFAECIVGADPGLNRPSYPMRFLLILMTFGFHALFSVGLMAGDDVLARSWFERLGRSWGASLGEDQYLGASLGWALGEWPVVVMGVALLVSWVRADVRERRRFDRREDRDGEPSRTDYNRRLAELSGPTLTTTSTTRGHEARGTTHEGGQT